MLALLLSKYWWILLLRGIVAVIFGLTAYSWPGLTLAMLVFFFGAYAFVDGVFNVVNAIGGRKEHEHWWWLLLEGAIGILFGVLTFQNPGVTALVLLFYMAAWAIVTGTLRIVMAIRLRKEIEGELWMGLSGLASVLFGLLMMARPGVGALAVLWMIAIWSMAIGVFMILLSFRARSFRPKDAAAPAAAR